jgi:ATP-binding cassette subfamily F protein 3
MSVVRFKNAKISLDDTTIIRDCNFRLDEKEKIGLIGRNGSGKTTLLRCILGEIEVSEGSVQRNDKLKFGYFSQFSQLESSQSILEILGDVFVEEKQIDTELLEITSALSDSLDEKALDKLLLRQAYLLERMEELDGWASLGSIDVILQMLHFDDVLSCRPINQLSEGWKNRAAFAKIILLKPDVLLLDEPTNFLDVEGLVWLERWLSKFEGGAIIITHDRTFLNNSITRIVEIENNRLQEYPTNYTEYTQLKPFKKKFLEGEFRRELELLALEKDNSEENKRKREKGGHLVKRGEVSRSRIPRAVDNVITDLYENLKFPEHLMQLKEISKSYGDDVLFSNLSMNLGKGDRLIVYGPNGCGKSTFLKVVAGELASDSGKITWSCDKGFISFSDVARDIDRNKSLSSVISLSKVAFANSNKKSNAFLKLMGFSENDMKKKVGALSGGQFSRAVLTYCLLSAEPVIILDEPTNHLDLQSIRIMERAFLFFPGAIIASSHDRFFIDSIATSMLIFEGGDVDHFRGDWSMRYGTK